KESERIGASVATGVGGLETLVEQVMVMRTRGPSRLSPFLVPMLMANAASAQISMQMGARGPSLTHVSACASSAPAIGEAAAITGGGGERASHAHGARARPRRSQRGAVHQCPRHLDALQRP